MEELVLDSGVRKIAIKNEDGDVITVLSINVADADTAERFGQVINKLERISENCEKEAAIGAMILDNTLLKWLQKPFTKKQRQK